jgi:hypothetical protein
VVDLHDEHSVGFDAFVDTHDNGLNPIQELRIVGWFGGRVADHKESG